jgi:hypothetical protein
MRFVTSRIHQWARQFDEAEKAWHELRWGRVAEALKAIGHPTSNQLVRQLLTVDPRSDRSAMASEQH